MKTSLLIVAAVVSAALYVFLPFLVFDRAELQYDIFFNQKIFYYHVPACAVMFVSVFVCGISSIGYLATRKPKWDDLAAAAGDLTVLFGCVVLTTGPIWARVAWGTWWVWDPRLTLLLLLFMIFVAYALIRRFGGPGSERLGAGLALFGMVDVPLVYFAVNFWRTQHPTNSVVPGLRGWMRITFWTGMLAYHILYLLLVIARRAVKRDERRLVEAADLAAETGLLE